MDSLAGVVLLMELVECVFIEEAMVPPLEGCLSSAPPPPPGVVIRAVVATLPMELAEEEFLLPASPSLPLGVEGLEFRADVRLLLLNTRLEEMAASSASFKKISAPASLAFFSLGLSPLPPPPPFPAAVESGEVLVVSSSKYCSGQLR